MQTFIPIFLPRKPPPQTCSHKTLSQQDTPALQNIFPRGFLETFLELFISVWSNLASVVLA